ncbi:MAG: hypothetical protein U5R31_05575 [Acidimicrobiia bacterium]|nr:hypothetical protein [Acidimicrobiia bacterium]
MLQIVQAKDLRILQLMNLTALTFVTGSILFTVASIPYLFHLRNATDESIVDSYLAAQYVAGSTLFLLGGLISYRRAYLVVRGIVGARSLSDAVSRGQEARGPGG